MDDKKSTGPNARAKNATIAQTGEGLPDDSSDLPEGAKDADEEKARASLDRSMTGTKPTRRKIDRLQSSELAGCSPNS